VSYLVTIGVVVEVRSAIENRRFLEAQDYIVVM